MGVCGSGYSILDLTLKYIEQTLPAEFITNGLADVCALVDGKDVLTDTERKNGARMKLGYSNKAKHFAFRLISWLTPNGLCVEH